jgi:hypothetical protein
MINNGNINVPDKTFAIFVQDSETDFSYKRLSSILTKNTKKRDWFPKDFYHCLPLIIANEYGYSLSLEYDIDVFWTGEESPDSLQITKYYEEGKDYQYPDVKSLFGNGILTVTPPFHIKTPPGVNTMTINPINYMLPNMSVISGVVETDNVAQSFSFSLKVHIPNVLVKIPKGFPIGSFIPIPRYFADDFVLEDGEKIFSEEDFVDELQTRTDSQILRDMQMSNNREDFGVEKYDGFYMRGENIYGEKFKDHQRFSNSKKEKDD